MVSRVQEYVEGRKVLDVELGNGALTVDKISLEGGSTFNFEPLLSKTRRTPSSIEAECIDFGYTKFGETSKSTPRNADEKFAGLANNHFIVPSV